MTARRPDRPADPAPLIRLGSGLAGAAGAGPRADLLDRCARAGLPVPAGAVLLDAARRWDGIDDADLAGPAHPAESITLRSAFAAPGGVASHTIQGLPAVDRPALVAAVRSIWATGAAAGVTRADVVLLAHVPGVQAGAAVTGPGRDDLVSWHEVTPEARDVGGDREVGRWAARPLRPRDRPHRATDRVPLPPWGMRLVRVLRDVREVVGAQRWDIEWVDDGRRCWLVGLQPAAGDVDRGGRTRRPPGRVMPDTP